MADEASKDPRVYFAAERTFLAWIRTGIALMGFGFVVARFGLFLRELELPRVALVNTSPRFSLWIGIALVAAGVFVTIAATAQQNKIIGRLKRDEWDIEHQSRLGVGVAAFLALAGVAMAVYLVIIH